MRHLTRIATTILAAFLAVGLPYGAGARSRHQQDTPLVVVLDPGHGGQDIGAADATQTLVEKTLTLQVARLAATTLGAMGYRVYLTRTRDQGVNTPPHDLNGDRKVDRIDEYDARNIFANRHHADVYVSIHFDGSGDPSLHGTHGYYCPARPFWRSNQKLATLLTSSVSKALTHAGYADPNNGVQTDVADPVPQARPDYPWFLVLGPSRHHWLTASAMPGALIETLYLSSPRDAAALRRSSFIAAIARGYADGIRAYFGGHVRK